MLATRRGEKRSTDREVEEELAELYGDELPGDALGREARTLGSRGSLYLGGGVGASKKQKGEKGEQFVVTKDEKEVKKHDTALSATAHAYKLAGAMSHPDTPGGETPISDPATAARVRELDGNITSRQRSIDSLSAERPRGDSRTSIVAKTDPDADYRTRAIARNRGELRRHKAERRMLLSRPSKVSEGLFDPAKHKRGKKGSPTGGQFVSAGTDSPANAPLVQGVRKNLGIGANADLTAAIRAYQEQHGLAVDGIVGAQTAASFAGTKAAAPGALTAADRSFLRSSTTKKAKK